VNPPRNGEKQYENADIESGEIGVVIVQDLSRLSRDCWQLDELVNLMSANDVLLISISDGGAANALGQDFYPMSQ
jgi:DNA invertase Pin-like site-specific DNA recombinase